MRLYPPAFLIARAAAAPDTIAGLPIRKNDVVLIAPWLLHRHEKLWRDPNAFIPERFMPPAPPPDRFAYLPFGVGARICIGAHFALVEATLALAKIIGAFRVDASRQGAGDAGRRRDDAARPLADVFASRRVDEACLGAPAIPFRAELMSDIQAQFSVLKQTADPAVADAIAQLIENGEDHELNRINVAGFFQAHRARRRAGDFRLSACLAARPVRSHLERALPRLQRRARCPRHAEIAAPRRLPLRTMRLRLRAFGRRAGRGRLYRQSQDQAHRRA